MSGRVCCICGAYTKYGKRNRGRGSRSFFKFPEIYAKIRPDDLNVLEKRIAAWKKVVGKNLNMHYGVQCVCSDHFYSGISIVIH